jgi:hypothetical protein
MASFTCATSTAAQPGAPGAPGAPSKLFSYLTVHKYKDLIGSYSMRLCGHIISLDIETLQKNPRDIDLNSPSIIPTQKRVIYSTKYFFPTGWCELNTH